jgi:hypothetical protein
VIEVGDEPQVGQRLADDRSPPVAEVVLDPDVHRASLK